MEPLFFRVHQMVRNHCAVVAIHHRFPSFGWEYARVVPLECNERSVEEALDSNKNFAILSNLFCETIT